MFIYTKASLSSFCVDFLLLSMGLPLRVAYILSEIILKKTDFISRQLSIGGTS